MDTTTNYALKKPAQTDFYNVDDFNYNVDTIDALLKSTNDTVATKATEESINAKFNDYEFWVSPTGSNSNAGTQAEPFLTIKKAIDSAPIACNSLTINLASGTYPEAVELTSYSRVSISCASGTATINSLYARSVEYAYFKGLTIVGETVNSRSVFIYASNFRLDTCIINNTKSLTTGVSVQFGTGMLISCTISGFSNGVYTSYGAVVALRSTTFASCTTCMSAFNSLIITDDESNTRSSSNGGFVISTALATAITNKKIARTDVGNTFEGNQTFNDTIITKASLFVKANSDTAQVVAYGATASANGASLWLYGNGNPNSGLFQIKTSDTNSVYHNLVGKPTGELTWDGKHIVRSIGGVYADSTGNVNVTTSTITYHDGVL